MRLDRFTAKAQEAIAALERIAAKREHRQLEPLHLLLAPAAAEGDAAGALLRAAARTRERARP